MIGDTLAKSYDFDTGMLVYSLGQRKKVEAVPLSNHVTFSKLTAIYSKILKQSMEKLATCHLPSAWKGI